jgi:hypothetical protein
MIAHQQREPLVRQAVSRGQHGYAILQVPVGVEIEVNRYAARNASLYRTPDVVRLVADNYFERVDAGVVRGLQCANDERFAQKRLKKLGLTSSAPKPITVSSG